MEHCVRTVAETAPCFAAGPKLRLRRLHEASVRFGWPARPARYNLVVDGLVAQWDVTCLLHGRYMTVT